MTMPVAERALERAAYQSAHGPRFPGENDGAGQCLVRTRLLYDAPSVGDVDHSGRASAYDGWLASAGKHHTQDSKSFPKGSVAWWSGGSHGDGHVAPVIGGGECWSTDIRRSGYYDRVPIDLIHQKWGLTLLGWTENINGVQVWAPQPEKDEDVDYLDWSKKAQAALAADVAAAVLGAKVPNKDAKGKPQGTMTVAQMITNIEWNQDQHAASASSWFKKLAVLVAPKDTK